MLKVTYGGHVMTKLWSVLVTVFKFFWPFAVAEAEKVAPEVQAKIDSILTGAAKQVEALKADHSVAAIKKVLADDVKAVEDFAKEHIALLTAAAQKEIAAASAVLPSVASQLAPDPSPPSTIPSQ